MRPDSFPQPSWRSRWVLGLAVLALLLFAVSLVQRVRCRLGGCPEAVARLLGPDSVGGLPRLYTTALFVAAAVLAGVAARRSAGRPRTWWALVAGIGVALAVAKLLSAHSVAKSDSYLLTLAVGVLLTAVTLWALSAAARRWDVPAGTPVVTALGIYAAAALGLDLVTSLFAAGALSEAAATVVEELGEALAALAVVVTVRRHLPEAER